MVVPILLIGSELPTARQQPYIQKFEDSAVMSLMTFLREEERKRGERAEIEFQCLLLRFVSSFLNSPFENTSHKFSGKMISRYSTSHLYNQGIHSLHFLPAVVLIIIGNRIRPM